MNRNLLYLNQILDGIGRIEIYVAVGQEAFLAEEVRQDAVIRQLEVIGAAMQRLAPSLRARHPGASWRSVTEFSDRLAHDYFNVDLDVVWDVTQQAMPELKHDIEANLADEAFA